MKLYAMTWSGAFELALLAAYSSGRRHVVRRCSAGHLWRVAEVGR